MDASGARSRGQWPLAASRSAGQHLRTLASVVCADVFALAVNAESADLGSRFPRDAPPAAAAEEARRHLGDVHALPSFETRVGGAVALEEILAVDGDQLAIQNRLVDAADRAAPLVRWFRRRRALRARGVSRSWLVSARRVLSRRCFAPDFGLGWHDLLLVKDGRVFVDGRRGRLVRRRLVFGTWPWLSLRLLRSVDAGATDLLVVHAQAA